MNFLAHAVLAGDAETDRVGGLIGDFIKGPLPAGLPPAIASGVALHRAIDSFAEQHDAFINSRRRISTTRRRVAGVLVDLFYDHLLARDWAQHASTPLAPYTDQIYAALQRASTCLPPVAREVVGKMQAGNWLLSYRHLAAVGLAIDRMSIYRIKRANPLAGGIEEFVADAEGFANDFAAFLPDARRFAAHWRAHRDAGVVPPKS